MNASCLLLFIAVCLTEANPTGGLVMKQVESIRSEKKPTTTPAVKIIEMKEKMEEEKRERESY